ncbi:MAG: NnrS family protein [Labilithrix sp.]|nr:NnrS family protein [Labilithrix sp.]
MAGPLPLHGLPSASALTRPRPAPPSGARFALFAKGFRPFFFLAALSAAALVPLWLLVLAGIVRPASHFDPATWHAHEMIFGFTTAVVAGFLLTAVGNWTQRETATGLLLGSLCALWALGRAAMSTSVLPPGVVAVVDLSFLPALAIVLARPLLAANNRRNFVMLGLLGALFAANAMTHAGALGSAPGWERRGGLVAVDVIVVLMLIIAGRVVPMFTRNATRREEIRSIPALDALAVGSMAALAVADVFTTPPPLVVAALSGAAAAFGAARAVTWGSRHTLRVPLLWILHVGYLWIPIGLALRALGAAAGGVYALMATHALTAGAIGALTLGMMARVSLGHTGRPLEAPRPVAWAFAILTAGAAVRVAAPLAPERYFLALALAGGLWAAAFAVYAVAYAEILVSPRADGRPG